MRISVSNLETYRRYKSNEDVTLEDCLADLRKESLPSPAMLAGSALHKALENLSDEYEGVELAQDHYSFEFLGSIELSIPPVRELKGEMLIDTPLGQVTLVGVVDVIGNEIGDYKLSGRFDAERLADSYQWRCYLMMFGCHKFVYKVFVGSESKDSATDWTIKEYHELPVYAYPGMEQDIQKELEECAAFMSEYVWGRKAA